jgi:hypothetical protein
MPHLGFLRILAVRPALSSGPARLAGRRPLSEPLEGRLLPSVSAPVPEAPAVELRPAAHASVKPRASSPALGPVYAGSAKLKSAVRHSHFARHGLTLHLSDDAGLLTGTAVLADLGTFDVSGTLKGRRFTLSVAGSVGGTGTVSAGQFRGQTNRRGTVLSGTVLGLAAGGQTYRGTLSLKAVTPIPPPTSGNEGNGTGTAGPLPRPDHVVIVLEENHSYDEVLGTQSTGAAVTPGLPQSSLLNQDDYVRQLASAGASFTSASAETHPSQPNYLALFSGSTQGVTDDASLANPLPGPDLGGELLAAGLSFAGYSEDLPSVGFTGDSSGDYARKHNPWSDFADVPPAANLPFGQFPTTDAGYANLPTVAFVVPSQQHDMHSGSIQDADQWLRQNLGGYAQWAQSHNSLLIVTWDEDDGGANNHIATIFSGQPLKPGQYGEPIDHYRLLRTVEDMYGLPPTGAAAQAQPITDVFK